jgi:drug/metabolite transporter (DMT)-like permease
MLTRPLRPRATSPRRFHRTIGSLARSRAREWRGLAVLGPDFAKTSLGLGDKGLVVVVLPLGLGIVTGVLAVNAYGHNFPRRRIIEAGLIVLGLLLACLGSIWRFLNVPIAAAADARGLQDLGQILSLPSIVVAIAFVSGMCYAVVVISAQTQLQEELPEEVRGRVFGVLNMLVSVSSLLPIMVWARPPAWLEPR